MNPVLSVITPSLNNGKFLQQTIDSIRNQNYRPVEHIITDAVSVDESIEVIKKNATDWVDGYRLIYTIEKDQGISTGFNRGLSLVTGKYIGYCMSDDYYCDKVFKPCLALLEQTGVAYVTGGYQIVLPDNSPMKGERWAYGIEWRPETCKSLLDKAVATFQPSVFMRTDLVKKVGGMNEGLKYVQDKDLWMKLVILGGVEFIREPRIVACWRHHGYSTSVKEHSQQQEEARYLYGLSKMYEESMDQIWFN